MVVYILNLKTSYKAIAVSYSVCFNSDGTLTVDANTAMAPTSGASVTLVIVGLPNPKRLP